MARKALSHNTNVGMLARLISNNNAYGTMIARFGGCSDSVRYDVMRVRSTDGSGRHDFAVCLMMPVQPRFAPNVDRSTEAMGKFGWTCWLFLAK